MARDINGRTFKADGWPAHLLKRRGDGRTVSDHVVAPASTFSSSTQSSAPGIWQFESQYRNLFRLKITSWQFAASQNESIKLKMKAFSPGLNLIYKQHQIDTHASGHPCRYSDPVHTVPVKRNCPINNSLSVSEYARVNNFPQNAHGCEFQRTFRSQDTFKFIG
jgi:hypothetical protein